MRYRYTKDGEQYLAEGWKIEQCSSCGGHGLVCDYGNGEDFYGDKKCDSCLGSGRNWITPKGRHVAYPGGPFC